MSVPVLIEEKLAARSLARFVGFSGDAEIHYTCQRPIEFLIIQNIYVY